MAGLAEVSVSLGETDLGEPRRGLPRLDIARIFRDYPDAGLSGFTLVQKLDASLPAGPGVLRVLAADLGGQTRQSIVPVTIPPPSAAGEADAQAGEALASDECRIHCACDVADLYTDGSLDISGWAFSDAGIGPIEIELNGITIGEVLADRKRPDIAARFPESPLAATSGFTFACAVPPPVKPGFHILSLRLSDRDGQKRVLEQPVPAVAPVARPGKRAAPAMVLQPAIRPEAAGMRLEVDEPSLEGHRARQVVRGALTISGWAVGPRGIETVSVLCDGESLEEAHCGMRREDIGAAFLDYPGSLLAGYALVLPPGSVAPGHHEIEVVARAGGNQPLGASPVTIEKRFSIEVESPESLPFGSAPRARIPAASIAFGLTLLEDAGFRPAFDIAIGLPDSDGTDLEPLAATLSSLSAQAYQDWTAEIFGSRSALSLARALPGSAGAKGRVRFAGKAPAKPLGTARQLRFLLRLRPGDRLGADALLELALHGAANRSADFLYADELRPDPAHGQQQQPFFKPDWSPDLLLAMNYIGRSWCATAELADAAGLTSEALASGSDYDAVLRLTEKAAQIGHVPVVLCARAGIGDAAEDEASALRAALERRGIAASVEAGSLQGTWRVRRMVQATKRAARGFTPGLVSIIIPTCSAGALIRTAIKTLRATSFPQRAGAPRIEIVVLDNTPPEETRARAWLRKNADTVIDMPGPFNWSRFNNIGAASAKGEYFLFLNDDIEATEPDWLEALLEHAQRPEVGVVGARLLYPDGKVQHAGQYLSAGHARHAFRFADAQSAGPFGLATVAREMISVTGACQIMHRRVFKQLGGFEEAHSIVNNDLDFCLRCWQAGLAVIYTPHATLLHHELASRARLDDRYDEALFDTAWRARFLRGDPFRNRHIGLSADEYGAEPEPAELVHAGRTLPQAASLRRILAVKLDHIGDFLTALPALHSLKREFPQARIDLLVPSASAALAAADSALAHGAPIDEVLVFDFFHARSGEGKLPVDETAFEALRARLAPKQYDLAIDLRMHPETRPVLRFTGASFVAGFDHANRFPWLDVALEWEGDARLASKRTHISERLVQLVSAAADACETGAPAAAWTQHAPERVPALAALPARFRSRPLVCIHPGVGNPVRQWPASSYAALIDMLSEQAGVNAVLIGTPDEASIGDEILQRVSAKGAAASLIGKVPLAELPALMQACVLFVGNNSGPQHIAARMGMPALGIHSGVVDAAEWAPLGTRAVAIRRRMVCAPCYLEFASDCPRQLACLTGLLPRDVFSACRRLLVGNVSLAQGGSATRD
jgi:ADP-heptose:LPS heptosyltransferase/GT2 family glycosyltransferase